MVAARAPAKTKPSNYPEPFASRMRGREKRPLGDLFGLYPDDDMKGLLIDGRWRFVHRDGTPYP